MHLHKKYGRGPLLELARRHGEFLVGSARKTAKGWSWNTLNVAPEQRRQDLNGFSHGAAGISWALLELWKATGEERFRVAAEQGFAYERQWFDPQAAPVAQGQSNYSLCHGSAGNAELLVYAARSLGDDSHRALAEQVGRFGVEQYGKTHGPWPCGVLQGGETPGLLLGLAGIGHFYLRLHDPAAIPSVLIILPEE